MRIYLGIKGHDDYFDDEFTQGTLGFGIGTLFIIDINEYIIGLDPTYSFTTKKGSSILFIHHVEGMTVAGGGGQEVQRERQRIHTLPGVWDKLTGGTRHWESFLLL